MFDALISAAATLFGARRQAQATESAAQTAANIQREMFERQIELQEPWRAAGVEALNRLIPLTRYQRFGERQFRQDPGYAFRLAEGQKALERSAAARGGLLSGGTLAATQRYGQDMASQEYQNAFNRYQIERAARLQPLQSLAGLGQTAANTLSTAAGQFGTQQGETLGNAMLARGSTYGRAYGDLGYTLGRYLSPTQQPPAPVESRYVPPGQSAAPPGYWDYS